MLAHTTHLPPALPPQATVPGTAMCSQPAQQPSSTLWHRKPPRRRPSAGPNAPVAHARQAVDALHHRRHVAAEHAQAVWVCVERLGCHLAAAIHGRLDRKGREGGE